MTTHSQTFGLAPAGKSFDYVGAVPFFLIHLACLAALWVGVDWYSVGLCLVTYFVRMFGITGVYHRYFSHKTYKTSRAMQFILGFIGCSSVQKGPMWWAAIHRLHHHHSDTEEDMHSPRQHGFIYSHVGWVLDTRSQDTVEPLVKDLNRYPEIRWLNEYHVVPGIMLAALCFWLHGWEGLVWGFFISTTILYHATYTINSLCHLFGKPRYNTGDDSKNNLFLALLTLGEGWHNNHHHYQYSTRQGFYWYEIDITYYILKVLSFCGLVWDLREPPDRVLEEGQLTHAQPARLEVR